MCIAVHHPAGAALVDAAAYFRYVSRWSAQFVAATLAAAKVTAGSRVLDVATGPGVAMEHAAAVGARGTVIGSDISTGMLAAASAEMVGWCHLVAGDVVVEALDRAARVAVAGTSRGAEETVSGTRFASPEQREGSST